MNVLKDDERQKITLVNYHDTNYIERRIYNDKRDIYKTLQQINHPNIPRIINVEFDSDTVITEEYIEGKKLSTLIEEKTIFTKKQIKSIMSQLISAMVELHKFNIIHRDIKPDNIILNESGHLWLIDFDIARIYREELRKDTEAMGTFGYAPIEQFGMLPTDFKTDIYSFGVTITQLLERSNIKGGLLKIAQKCKRLDPSERYQTAQQIKKALSGVFKITTVTSVVVAVSVLTSVFLLLNAYSDTESKQKPLTIEDVKNFDYDNAKKSDKYIEVDEDVLELLNFEGFTVSEKHKELLNCEYFESTDIFVVDELWAHLSFFEDKKDSGIIYLGKDKETAVEADIELKNGVLSLNLTDNYGHSFSKDFAYNPDNKYTLTYPDNRQQNAELICRDLDGDFIQELLIGVNDCSLKIADNKIFCYFNYSQAWCLKYDEARGFTLCEGEMFSDNSKFAFFENDLRIHLPVYAITEDGRCGYILNGTKIMPFY